MDALMDGAAEICWSASSAKPKWNWAGGKVKPQHRRPALGVAPCAAHPRPPQWGARVVREMPLEMVFQHLYKNELFRLSWGAKNTHGEEWEKLQAEFEAAWRACSARRSRKAGCSRRLCMATGPLRRMATTCCSIRPSRLQAASPEELLRFTFPRQPSGRFPVPGRLLCAARFRHHGRGGPAGGHGRAGKPPSASTAAKAGDYSEAYFTHGLAVQTAEATADYLHRHIRRELGLPEGQGKRYSWGYPAIPIWKITPKFSSCCRPSASWA
jgi:5-methyltetrahydrofolate--homocysteine methyltransferase